MYTDTSQCLVHSTVLCSFPLVPFVILVVFMDHIDLILLTCGGLWFPYVCWYRETSLSPPVFFTDRSKAVLRLWIFVLFVFHVCLAVLSVHFKLVVTCWERANLLSLLYVMCSCVFGTSPCGVLGQVWYLIVTIPDLCILPGLNI